MAGIPNGDITHGERCTVVGGIHKGKSGIVRDRHMSKSGNVTITVEQANGTKFKTLARSVERQA